MGLRKAQEARLENNTDSHEGFKRHGQGTCERRCKGMKERVTSCSAVNTQDQEVPHIH